MYESAESPRYKHLFRCDLGPCDKLELVYSDDSRRLEEPLVEDWVMLGDTFVFCSREHMTEHYTQMMRVAFHASSLVRPKKVNATVSFAGDELG